MVETLASALTCWKCNFGHRTYDSYCRACGADWDSPPRQPTEEEAAPWGRADSGGNPMTASKIKRPRK